METLELLLKNTLGNNAKAAAWCRFDGLASTLTRNGKVVHTREFKMRLLALQEYGKAVARGPAPQGPLEVALRELLARAYALPR